jgi:hydrogenase-4 membrane subunit HyfE
MIGLSIAGMVFGLTMMWRQRKHLRAVVGAQFKDDNWNFGQFAALFIWAPILVELLYILNGWYILSSLVYPSLP